MQKHLFTRKRIPLFLCLSLLLLLVFFLFWSNREKKQFDRLTTDLFKEEFSENTLNLHFTLAYPENYGISYEEALLPCYSATERKEAGLLLDEYIEKLNGFSLEKLDEKQQYTYTLLNRYLTLSQEGNQFPYYDEPLSPSSGMQSQLPILLAEYTFRSLKDVEDYLSILDQTDDYFLSLLTYEQEKKEEGLLQADTTLAKVCEQCYTILSKEELDAGNHFLQITFLERLLALEAAGLLSAQEKESYISENNRLLRTVMQPAYETLADGLYVLMGDGTSVETVVKEVVTVREEVLRQEVHVVHRDTVVIESVRVEYHQAPAKKETHYVYYGLNTSTLSDASLNTIQQVAAAMIEDEDLCAEIVGYGDNTGSIEYNEKLTNIRAKNVFDELVNEYDIPAERIVYYSGGVIEGKRKGIYSANRRVEIRVIPSADFQEVKEKAETIKARVPAVSSPATEVDSVTAEKVLTVEDGMTLSGIAFAEYGNASCWMYIYEANKETMSSPDELHLGQKLIIPALTQEQKRLVKSVNYLK